MENEPTPEQRVAYKDWRLADEAAMNARDAVLAAMQVGEGLIDLDAVERLSQRANDLRMRADQMLQRALKAVHCHDQEPTQAGDETDSRFASMIRTIVDMELRQIGRRSYERHDEPSDSLR
jgi:predicted metal-dependent phosphotriesterase family hydrolase